MKYANVLSLAIILCFAVSLAGCGISKDKYETLLNEKIALEEKVNIVARAKDALKNEYDNLLKEKMDLSTKLEVVTNEKNAMKGEYDKILDEKIVIKAAHDKLIAENKELRDRLAND